MHLASREAAGKPDDLKFDEFISLLCKRAQIHDHGRVGASRPRRNVNVNVMESGYEYDDEANNGQLQADVHDVDTPYEFIVNQAERPRQQTPRRPMLTRQVWRTLSDADKRSWDLVTDEGKRKIIDYVVGRNQNQQGPTPGGQTYSGRTANEHNIAFEGEDKTEGGGPGQIKVATHVVNPKKASDPILDMATRSANMSDILRDANACKSLSINQVLSQKPSKDSTNRTITAGVHEMLDRSDFTPQAFSHEINYDEAYDYYEEEEEGADSLPTDLELLGRRLTREEIQAAFKSSSEDSEDTEQQSGDHQETAKEQWKRLLAEEMAAEQAREMEQMARGRIRTIGKPAKGSANKPAGKITKTAMAGNTGKSASQRTKTRHIPKLSVDSQDADDELDKKMAPPEPGCVTKKSATKEWKEMMDHLNRMTLREQEELSKPKGMKHRLRKEQSKQFRETGKRFIEAMESFDSHDEHGMLRYAEEQVYIHDMSSEQVSTHDMPLLIEDTKETGGQEFSETVSPGELGEAKPEELGAEDLDVKRSTDSKESESAPSSKESFEDLGHIADDSKSTPSRASDSALDSTPSRHSHDSDYMERGHGKQDVTSPAVTRGGIHLRKSGARDQQANPKNRKTNTANGNPKGKGNSKGKGKNNKKQGGLCGMLSPGYTQNYKDSSSEYEGNTSPENKGPTTPDRGVAYTAITEDFSSPDGVLIGTSKSPIPSHSQEPTETDDAAERTDKPPDSQEVYDRAAILERLKARDKKTGEYKETDEYSHMLQREVQGIMDAMRETQKPNKLSTNQFAALMEDESENKDEEGDATKPNEDPNGQDFHEGGSG